MTIMRRESMISNNMPSFAIEDKQRRATIKNLMDQIMEEDQNIESFNGRPFGEEDIELGLSFETEMM